MGKDALLPTLSLEMATLTKICIFVRVELGKLEDGKNDKNMSFYHI